MTSSFTQNQERKVGFLDILIIAAESWKLMVFAPLVVALMTAGVAFLSPKTYESVAIVKITEEELILIHTIPVLDSVIEKLNLLADSKVSIHDARQSLKNNLAYTVDAKSKLSFITAIGATPEQAQQLGVTAVEQLILRIKSLRKEEIKEIENNINANEQAINIIENNLDYLRKNLSKEVTNEKNQESTYKTMVSITSELLNLKKDKEKLQSQLRRFVIVVQEPSLPVSSVPKKRGLIVLAAFVLSGFLLFIILLVRNEFEFVSKNELTSSKINQIKKAFLK